MSKLIFDLIIGIKCFQDKVFGLWCQKPNYKIKKARKKSSTHLTSKETLCFNSADMEKVEKINAIAKEVLKDSLDNPEKVLKFIESRGTKIIRAPHIEKVLLFFGDEEGFVTPKKGFKALIFSVLVDMISAKKIPVGFKTPELFAVREGQLNIYYLAHQFHHWLAYKKGLPGYDEDTVENFKSIWSHEFCAGDIYRMSIDEILSLKDAIARDTEAIKFVKDISRELIGTRKSIKRLKNGESLNI